MSATLAATTSPDAARILRSLAWRFVRHGSSILGSILAIFCGGPALLYGLLWIADPQAARHLVADPRALRGIFVLGEWIALPSLMVTACAQIRPLYVLPMTNRFLVNTQLALGMVLVAGVHLLTVLFYLVAFDATIPAWEPLLDLCPLVVVFAGLAALLADFRWWKPFVALGVVGAGLWYVGYRSADPSVTATASGWLTPTLSEVMFLFLVAPIGYWQTLRSVTRDRCGDLRAWPDLEQMLNWLGALIGRLQPGRWRAAIVPSSTPSSTQFWYQYLHAGLLIPVISTGLITLSLIYAYAHPHDWLRGAPQLFYGALMFGMMFSGAIGGCLGFESKNPKDRGMRISHYLATRPLTDTQIGYTALRVSLASVLLSCVIAACFVVIVYGWSLFHVDPGLRGAVPRPLYFRHIVGAGTAGWILLGLAASIMMTGRGWLVFIPFFLMLSSCLLSPLLNRAFPNPETNEQISQLLSKGTMLLVGLATVAAFVVAYRRGLLSTSILIMSALLWLVAFAVIVWNSMGTQADDTWLISMFGLASLAVAPLATAPLAVAWNRHR